MLQMKSKTIKSNKKNSKTLFFYLLILLILFFMAFPIFYFYLEKNDIKSTYLREKIESKNISLLYDFYFAGEPSLENNPFYGSQNASVTFTAFLNPASSASRQFIHSSFPAIYNDYISTGKMRYYGITYLTFDDYKKRNERFFYAKYLYCFKSINNKSYYDIYFDLFNASNAEESLDLTQKYNISKQEIAKCISKTEPDELKNLAILTESLGLVGIEPHFYVGINEKFTEKLSGIQTDKTFKKAIKNMLIKVGELG